MSPRKHYATPEEAFHARTVLDSNGCWIWTGAKSDRGYGQLGVAGKVVYVHRWSYERFKGPIPAKLVIDHTCEVPLWANPEHLEAVTNSENLRRRVRRAKFCKRGHPRTEETTWYRKDGRVGGCRMCATELRKARTS